ncbi:MAG: alpha-ribazole phosphatase family protein [Ectothiorhodospiraceae bacterium]|jgi:alpha-ribazole phosphatase/probable phosphoglycerate mutase
MQRIEREDEPETLIDLIRHGMPVGGRRYRGHRDDPLSEEGWEQMWSAVGGNAPWHAVVTSPLARCEAFARSLGERHGLPVEVDPGFKEISFGDWEGRRIAEILAAAPEQVSAYWRDPVAHPPPGGEPLESFRERVAAALEAVAERHQGEHTLVVCHGGVIRTLLSHVLRMPLAAVLRIEVPNAGLTRLRMQRDVNGAPAPSLVFHARQSL